MIVADFIKEDVFSEIEDQLRGLNIGVLGWIFFFFSMLYLKTTISAPKDHRLKDIGQ